MKGKEAEYQPEILKKKAELDKAQASVKVFTMMGEQAETMYKLFSFDEKPLYIQISMDDKVSLTLHQKN